MKQRGKDQYELVKKLSFVRYGGTPEEDRAREILANEIFKAGGTCEALPFPIKAYENENLLFEVTAPYEKTIHVLPYGRSGDLDGEFGFFYAGDGKAMDYAGIDSLENSVVLINALTYDAYKILCEKKAAAFLTVNGMYYQSEKTADLNPRSIRYEFLENGRIPGFMLIARDAMELVRRKTKRIRIRLSQREIERKSHNLLAVIPGTASPEESIVLTAHYDSVAVGTGSWDNATGSANLMYLYKTFLSRPTRRTLRFLWCGSEEQGLLGSHAFVDANPELVESIRLCFNFDMCGTILGSNNIKITGGDDLYSYVDQYCKEVGWSADLQVRVHSSDSAPFADRGVPSIGISRGTKSAEIHTRHDVLATISADELQKIGAFSSALIERTANSIVLPVKREMPESMKKELDRYFQRH